MASLSLVGLPPRPAPALDPALVRQKADELDAMGLHDTADLMRQVAAEVEAEGASSLSPDAGEA